MLQARDSENVEIFEGPIARLWRLSDQCREAARGAQNTHYSEVRRTIAPSTQEVHFDCAQHYQPPAEWLKQHKP